MVWESLQTPEKRVAAAPPQIYSPVGGPGSEATTTVQQADGLLGVRARTAVGVIWLAPPLVRGQLGDDQWRHLLADHSAVVRQQVEAQRGREIKTTGDGFLIAFDSPARAVRCARAIRDGTTRLGMDVRAAIHTGECELTGGDITGNAVHLAARVLDATADGEVLVSGTVRDLLLGSGLGIEDRGRHKLKGIEGDWQLFALVE